MAALTQLFGRICGRRSDASLIGCLYPGFLLEIITPFWGRRIGVEGCLTKKLGRDLSEDALTQMACSTSISQAHVLLGIEEISGNASTGALCNKLWMTRFPQTAMRHLEMVGSDHRLILLMRDAQDTSSGPKTFQFLAA
ncbi:unnamed protein product [Linum trigynum]|uniref:Uncharacterized protein n=1 Tax=Linum trigynum TaxID=586398 RepID=A0AAV2E895_9ROSI